MARSCCRDVVVLGSVLIGVASLGGASGCTGKDPYRPGDSVGVFQVTAKLVSSTCGQPPNPWQFDVRLRHDRSTVYWVQGDAPISGVVDPSARAVLKATGVTTMRDADAKAKLAACVMSRDDVVDLTFAPVATPGTDIAAATSFKGTLGYHFGVTDGSQCDDQLADSGGDFAALPCDVQYELAGVRTGDAK